MPSGTTVDGIPPTGSTVASRWLAAGYTTAKMVDAGNQVINSTMAAFPNKPVGLAIGLTSLELDPLGKDYVADTVINTPRAKWGNRMVATHNNMSEKPPVPPPPAGSYWSLIYDLRPAVGGQMLWWSYGDSTCRNAENGAPCDAATVLTHSVERAYEYGWNYLEIYSADIVGLPSVIHYAHTLLAQSSPTPAPTPTPTPGPTPTVTISSSLQRVSKGGSASFIISAQPAPSQPITVHYLMRGRALLGFDYTLSGTPGQATIPAGQSSATIILNTLTDNIHEKNERAIMTLSPGSGYQLPRRNKRAKKATIRISNAP